MRQNPFFKNLSLILVCTVFFLTLPSQGWAMFVPSVDAHLEKQTDRSTIQKALESAVVKQRLMDYGLTPDEALQRIDTLSDQQIHSLAGNLESIQAGGDGVGTLIVLVVVAILVVVILQATGHKVIIR